MKKLGLVVFVACVSSLVTLGLFLVLAPRETIVIREPVNSFKVALEDGLFSGIKQREFLSTAPTNFTGAAGKAIPAVVYIRSVHSKGYWRQSYSASSGSGVVISPNGYIVTNHHVIDKSDQIKVVMNDRREYDVEVVGVDATTDIALLKIEADGLNYLEFGNSDSVLVGEWVLAVGNPFRLESTVTAGIVSAKARSIRILESDASVESFIQTDAVVNQGNSGGALVNTNGELIGINAAIITQSGKYEGYSFAIPSNLAQKVIGDLKEFGEVKRGLLGVNIRNLTNDLANELRLNEIKGVYIEQVGPNSAAEKGGLERGDVILKVDGAQVSTFPELQEIVARRRPGEKVRIEYLRNHEKFETDVVLQQRFSNETDHVLIELGFEIRDLSNYERNRYNSEGARVFSIHKNSKIDGTNMEIDFIITSVNGNNVKSSQEVTEAIKLAKQSRIELGGFYPQYDGEYFYEFTKN